MYITPGEIKLYFERLVTKIYDEFVVAAVHGPMLKAVITKLVYTPEVYFPLLTNSNR